MRYVNSPNELGNASWLGCNFLCCLQAATMQKADTGAYSPTASGDAADAIANGVTAAVDSAKPPAMNGRDAGSSKSASAGGQGNRRAAADPLVPVQAPYAITFRFFMLYCKNRLGRGITWFLGRQP